MTLTAGLLASIPVALAAGLVSFFSPCVLPLVPGYFSYATGVAASKVVDGGVSRGRMLAGASLFMSGFGAVFIALGVAAGTFGMFAWRHFDSFSTILALLMIACGLVFLGLVPAQVTWFKMRALPGVGLAFAPILGAMFAIVWLPCVGPVLGAILTMASSSSPTSGGILLVAYTIGFGTPFIAAALAWHKALAAFKLIARHRRLMNATAGIAMVVVGVAMLLGWWTYLSQWAQLQAVQFWY